MTSLSDKVTKNREQNEINRDLFLMPRCSNFGEANVTKNRVQNEINPRFISYAEMK